MWQRKPKNRRKRREEHVLEVKVHSDYQRQLRVRYLTVILTVSVVLALVTFGVYRLGKFATRKFFHENPRFAIVAIEVRTDGHLTQEQIVGLANVRNGQSVFSVDLQQVKRDLELEPLIERAEVGRELPNRIHIDVTERVPLAQICVQPFAGSSQSRLKPIIFYVDKFGVAMQAFALKPNKTLPALTGVRLAEIRVGKPIQSPQVYAALDLARALEMSTVGVRLDVERIDLSRADSLAVITRNGETISFDPHRISQGLRRLGVILADAQRNRLALATVDLTVQQNVPATFRNVEAAN